MVAFISQWGGSLQWEARQHNVDVTILEPGHMETGLSGQGRKSNRGVGTRLPSAVARDGLEALVSGQVYTTLDAPTIVHTFLARRVFTRQRMTKLMGPLMKEFVDR